jgi:tmRNA-binding protein
MIPIKKGFGQRGASSLLLYNFALEYATRKFQVRQDGLKLRGTHQLTVRAGDVCILDGYINTIKNTEALLRVVASKVTGQEVNTEKCKW